jgi:hypothetical protein
MRSIVWITVCAAVVTAAPARAQLVGSFEGTLARKSGAVPVAAVFKQVDAGISGTVALPGDLATFGGEYLVIGTATSKRIKIQGGGGEGGFLKAKLKIKDGTLRGKVNVKVGGQKLGGKTTLTPNPPLGDGSSCDAVYQANQALFDDQVMDDVFEAVCAECHASGFEAEATRFRVTVGDSLATARSAAVHVDAGNPAGSRLRVKPLNLVPHGGGAEVTAGSPEEMLLDQWITLVAAAQCS